MALLINPDIQIAFLYVYVSVFAYLRSRPVISIISSHPREWSACCIFSAIYHDNHTGP